MKRKKEKEKKNKKRKMFITIIIIIIQLLQQARYNCVGGDEFQTTLPNCGLSLMKHNNNNNKHVFGSLS